MPEKQAVPGHVSTHCPTRSCTCLCMSLLDIVNSSTESPARPSGVSDGSSSRSIPASQPQAMTEVAKPVMLFAAW